MAHTSLESYYQTNFALIQHHKYSLSELESLYPYERDLYVDMLKDYLKEEQQRMAQRQ